MRSRENNLDVTAALAALTLLIVLLLPGCDSDAPLPANAADTSGILQAISRSVEGSVVHQVRMTQHGDRYAFEPAEVTVAAGDVVRFVMVGNQPESVVFATSGLPPPVAEHVISQGLDRGVLLTEPGSTFDVSFRDAPSGDYPFRSIPHFAAGMKGRVHVVEPDS